MKAWSWILIIMKLKTKNSPPVSIEENNKVKQIISMKKQSLGKMTMHEKLVLVLFIILICLWFFQKPIFIPGWSDVFTKMSGRTPPSKISVASATPAMLIVIVVFLLPVEFDSSSSQKSLLDWKTGDSNNINMKIVQVIRRNDF